jgi:5-methylcytosine-specific restriction endonuclease McrA
MSVEDYPTLDAYRDSDEFAREMARYDLEALRCLWGVSGLDGALVEADRLTQIGDPCAHDALWDMARAALQEVFDRLIAAGVDPGQCVAETAAIARDFAVDVYGWQPRRRTIPPRVRTLVYRRDGYACAECGEDDVRKLTLDHRVPVHMGGSDLADNLITRCRSCNSSKGKEVRP